MRAPTDDLSDLVLAERVAASLAVPRATVASGRSSFVLHAPLELLARVSLLPLVAPSARTLARRRITLLAEGYEASGPPLAPARPADFASPAGAAAALSAAVDAEDLDAVDEAATWLAGHAAVRDLAPLLAPTSLDRLSAAGHANIYLELVARPAPSRLGVTMLRPVARALAVGAADRITIPPIADGGDPVPLAKSVANGTVLGPTALSGIAPMVRRAQENGVFARLLDDTGRFVSPSVPPSGLLRAAARTMLQGSAAHAPYGWTHCFTLAQAPLVLAGAGAVPVGQATWVGAAYVAAHWSAYGEDQIDLDRPVPRRTEVTANSLATAASVSHDAHLVKYTLACLDAAATDPMHRDLYLAAASHLHRWWEERGDPNDPLGAVASHPKP
ncbi:MAG: hypothetical protein ABIP03_07825 [Aquihabitans sp.]